MSVAKILESLDSKPSASEEHGLALIKQEDLIIFSPGISTAGFAEIKMARSNPRRKVIATTIDEKGLDFARRVIEEVGFANQIETRLEDLREVVGYPDNFFDFIYARLVLHYLSSQDLDAVLANFDKVLKDDGKLFVVVRSVKNIPERDDVLFDEKTRMTSIPHYDPGGSVSYWETRYFHTPESIRQHLEQAGFDVVGTQEYQEQLYKDFMRKEISPNFDHIIEVIASKTFKVSDA